MILRALRGRAPLGQRDQGDFDFPLDPFGIPLPLETSRASALHPGRIWCFLLKKLEMLDDKNIRWLRFPAPSDLT